MNQYELIMDNSGQRLDAWLSAHMTDLSRSYINELIKLGRVQVDGNIVKKPSLKPENGAKVFVDVPEPELIDVKPQDIALNIAYEDEWLLVIDKPQGMVVHPAAGHKDGTLVNALLAYCKGELSDINGVIRPGIVHRIDKDTSGLLLVVKNNLVHNSIADQIRKHEVVRTYRTVVYGSMPADKGTIDAPVGRDKKHRQRMAVVADGKPSVTHFEVLERYAKATYIEARLETGRTHQIRVHMKYAGHPVIGDPLYAPGRPNFDLNGQALHACQLSFTHPITGQVLTVESPLPDWFDNLLEKLK
ncbi:MAG: RluA family pseudouridine synthase [Eubacteriales bacterium]|nr:RluA family pseudouridine synthase [Eubacteriales bacterium]MDD3197111.1 RluA family pseudouridine synthase [Eubacteriales bacterium]MDD4681581.1 RluA family pseudouridine synthase [Eubacteriales bacterium]